MCIRGPEISTGSGKSPLALFVEKFWKSANLLSPEIRVLLSEPSIFLFSRHETGVSGILVRLVVSKCFHFLPRDVLPLGRKIDNRVAVNKDTPPPKFEYAYMFFMMWHPCRGGHGAVARRDMETGVVLDKSCNSEQAPGATP